ncbi:hypothetical protein ACFV6B_25560 [Streptomyces microflavus]|uniref:hypothetical protein n=1 Tax=Streptomyces microflavus TaxID=1919 RepID=UPI00365CAB3A
MSEGTALESTPVEDEDRADDTEPDSQDSTEGRDSPDGTDEHGRRPRWPRLLGALLTVVLLATGGALFAEGQQLRDTPATANLALTDAEATTRVTGDVSNALGRIFSYGPDATALTKDAAREVLAGKALQQYAALFGQVEKQAADQKLTLTTHVVRAGVTRLTGSSAHLLVFLDQVYERRGRPATTASAQLSVTAELRDGQWRIVEIGSI